MIPTKEIHETLDDYNPSEITIATICRHSARQLFYSAKNYGFKTIGFYQDELQKKTYKAFPAAEPDRFIQVKDYRDIGNDEITKELLKKNTIIIPHGSFVNLGSEFLLDKLEVPMFGNRSTIKWESDRKKQREWLEEKAGLKMPKEYKEKDIVTGKIYFVKFGRARGGRGFFPFRTKEEFKKEMKDLRKLGEIDEDETPTIQEYVSGTRYYFSFFQSPLSKEGWQVEDMGQLAYMGTDRRDETNIDDLFRVFLDFKEMKKIGIKPTYNVVGNIPIVARESNLPKVFEMADRTVSSSKELFGGVIGPFCLETFCKPNMEYEVFEISGRIVAGTNVWIDGSPDSTLTYGEKMSMGDRIMMEIKEANKTDMLKKIIL